MDAMKRALLVGTAVALALAVMVAVVANTVALPNSVLIALYLLAVGLPAAVGVLADSEPSRR